LLEFITKRNKENKFILLPVVSISFCWLDTSAGYHEKQQAILSLKCSKQRNSIPGLECTNCKHTAYPQAITVHSMWQYSFLYY